MIPPGANCLIPECNETPSHILSLRMRREDTGADWAPNLPAYFCDAHSIGGVRITMLYEPTDSAEVEVHVMAAAAVAHRTTPIRRRGGVKI